MAFYMPQEKADLFRVQEHTCQAKSWIYWNDRAENLGILHKVFELKLIDRQQNVQSLCECFPHCYEVSGSRLIYDTNDKYFETKLPMNEMLVSSDG